ncbi:MULTISPECIES: sigma-E processing peptidase SpoIIGA [Neobacillus]|uniref:sigma-E processing peptidase SpoIIGA n=1 Tax=Neobacillus TaxID=2675232 RepID=UPI0004F59C82|nr:sigma-E processing peptidase SpoIIGA [Neobacillus sedimentimangrovi]AIM17621.1 peptidase [Bacillus sp. X1(2014)]
MTVYLDVIWALNFLFDSLLLYLTGIFLKRDIRIWRILIGGFIGSLIILLSFTSFQVYSGHPISKLLFSVLMILTVFGFKRVSFFIKALMTFYVSTFIIGGALIGIHYFIQYDSVLTTKVLMASVKGFGDPISWGFVLIGFPIAWHFSRKNIESMEMTKIKYDQLVEVNIEIENELLTFKGLIDSGNQLYDPISKLPVMIVSIKNQIDAVSEPIQKLASSPEPLINGNIEFPVEWESRMRVIPYKVVGHNHQLIIAIKPDRIIIKHDGIGYLCEKGLISFTMQQLSADDTYECIVHPKMLTGQRLQGESVKVS